MASLSDDDKLASICKLLPCREAELTKLWRIISHDLGPLPHILVYGVSGVGKTSAIRRVLEAAGKRHAYICCTPTTKPQQVQHSILSQLKRHKRTRDTGYGLGVNVEHTADFIQQLGEVCPANAPAAFIVIDNSEIVASSNWLPALLRCRELCDEAVNINVILLSRHSWGSGTYTHLGRFYYVHFKAYNHDQLARVLLAMADVSTMQVPLYTQFVQNVIIPSFVRLTRHCQDHHVLAQCLYPHYRRPLQQQQVPPDLQVDVLHRRLVSQPYFQNMLNTAIKKFQPGCMLNLSPGHNEGSSKLDFELPSLGKWLLLAAYVASRNKPTLDRTVFDATAKSGKVRGRGGRAMDLQADAAAEAGLKGPHAFPLRRLMLIYDALLRSCCMLGANERDDDDSTIIASLLAEGQDVGGGGGTRGSQASTSKGLPLGSPAFGSRAPSFSPLGKAQKPKQFIPIPDDSDEEMDLDAPKLNAVNRRISNQGLGAPHNAQKWHPKGLQPQETNNADLLKPDLASFHHQLSTLVSLRFLSQGSEDMLDGPRYYCNIDDEVGKQLATSLKVDLSRYIRYV